jgi:type II secretory pathway pseudopilin PulG
LRLALPFRHRDGMKLAPSQHVFRNRFRSSSLVMQNDHREFSLLDGLVVIAILLLVATIAIQEIVHSIRASEQATIHSAAVEYTALRSMYSGQFRTVSSGTTINRVSDRFDVPTQ